MEEEDLKIYFSDLLVNLRAQRVVNSRSIRILIKICSKLSKIYPNHFKVYDWDLYFFNSTHQSHFVHCLLRSHQTPLIHRPVSLTASWRAVSWAKRLWHTSVPAELIGAKRMARPFSADRRRHKRRVCALDKWEPLDSNVRSTELANVISSQI